VTALLLQVHTKLAIILLSSFSSLLLPSYVS
jgi:hypothetical protein